MGQTEDVSGREIEQHAHRELDGRHSEGELKGEVEGVFGHAMAGGAGTAVAAVATILIEAAQESIGGDGGKGDIHDPVRLRHTNFKAETEGFIVGRHEALQLGGLEALFEFEGGAERGPSSLQFATEDADDALHDSFFDLGNLALLLVHASDAAQEQVDDGEDEGWFQVEGGGCGHGIDLKGCEVGEVGDAMEKLAEGELLDRDQIDLKDDAQIGAESVGEVAGEALVEIADGANLVLLDLSGLFEIAGLIAGLGALCDLASSEGGTEHGVDFILVQYFFHASSRVARTAWSAR